MATCLAYHTLILAVNKQTNLSSSLSQHYSRASIHHMGRPATDTKLMQYLLPVLSGRL